MRVCTACVRDVYGLCTRPARRAHKVRSGGIDPFSPLLHPPIVWPMRYVLFGILCLILVACGRPLTEAERAYVFDIHGETLDTDRVRIRTNRLIGLISQDYPTRPPVTCRERIVPPPTTDIVEGRTAGLVLFNRLHVREPLFSNDYSQLPDETRNLYAAMFFAHEMTHIWQWQNRDITNYHPLRAVREHATVEDPYLFSLNENNAFLDYGYEAQASLVEEYVCCRALDPTGARTDRLERLIAQVMPVTPWQERADETQTFVPWSGVEPRGICS